MVLKRLFSELAALARNADSGTFAAYLGAMAVQAPAILRARSLLPADEHMRLRRAVFRTWAGEMAVKVGRRPDGGPEHGFGLARELFAKNVYLRPFRPFSAKGETVLDVGGNVGMFSVLAAHALAAAQIVFIEPQSAFFAPMRELLDAYPQTEVVPVEGLVGAAVAGLSGEPLDLDKILASYPRIALAKLDIEGAEEPLFLNAGPWLDRVERIAMEIHPLECNASAVVAALTGRGFIVRTADPMGAVVPPERAMYAYAVRRPADFVD